MFLSNDCCKNKMNMNISVFLSMSYRQLSDKLIETKIILEAK